VAGLPYTWYGKSATCSLARTRQLRRFDFDWTSPGATATDAEGKITPVKIEGGRVSLAVSVTPVFIEAC
jgi:hypothetical protein